MDFHVSPIRKNHLCPVCGENPSITELRDEAGAMNVCDRDTKSESCET
jgi:molybdopterin-synthase adenylyltransferase